MSVPPAYRPASPVIATPRMKYFCATTNRTRIGTSMAVAPAMSRFQSLWYCPRKDRDDVGQHQRGEQNEEKKVAPEEAQPREAVGDEGRAQHRAKACQRGYPEGVSEIDVERRAPRGGDVVGPGDRARDDLRREGE